MSKAKRQALKDERKQKREANRKPLPNAMIGLGIGGGATINRYVIYPNGTLDFNFAISANKKWAIGLYTQWCIYESLNLGLQFVNGDYTEKASFIWGLGVNGNLRNGKDWYSGEFDYYNTNRSTQTTYERNGTTIYRMVYHRFPCFGPDLRLGFATKGNFFMLFDVALVPNKYPVITERYQTGDQWHYSTVRNQMAATVTMTMGYCFKVQPAKNAEKKRQKKLQESLTPKPENNEIQ